MNVDYNYIYVGGFILLLLYILINRNQNIEHFTYGTAGNVLAYMKKQTDKTIYPDWWNTVPVEDQWYTIQNTSSVLNLSYHSVHNRLEWMSTTTPLQFQFIPVGGVYLIKTRLNKNDTPQFMVDKGNWDITRSLTEPSYHWTMSETTAERIGSTYDGNKSGFMGIYYSERDWGLLSPNHEATTGNPLQLNNDGYKAISLKIIPVLPTPIDGVWNNDWSPVCVTECGKQATVQTRTCEPPKYGGSDCDGSPTRTCIKPPNCPIDGGWSDWSGTCDTTCDTDPKTQTRTCTNPSPQYDGAQCIGSATKSCPVNRTCGIDGGWSIESDCDTETGTKTRTCNNPIPSVRSSTQEAGLPCTQSTDALSISGQLGTAREVISCDVDCEVSEWSTFSGCSKECGGGEQTRTRTITQQSHNDGLVCPELSETIGCNPDPCPIDGVLSSWSTCNKTCGPGMQFRTCDEPMYGGNECIGDLSRTCQIIECKEGEEPQEPIDAVWSNWGTCIGSCGTGTQSRTCIPPKLGGLSCEQMDSENLGTQQDCQLNPCLSQEQIDASVALEGQILLLEAQSKIDAAKAADEAAIQATIEAKAAANAVSANSAKAAANAAAANAGSNGMFFNLL